MSALTDDVPVLDFVDETEVDEDLTPGFSELEAYQLLASAPAPNAPNGAIVTADGGGDIETYVIQLHNLLAALDSDVAEDDDRLTEFLLELDVSRMPPQLQEYWLGPKGSARVGGWGNEGSFTKCTIEMRKEGIPGRMIKGVCGNLYKHATGHGPTKGKHKVGHKYLSEEDMVKLAVADNPQEPYGDVKYADPGYQGDGRKRYPINTPDHIRAAWSYINMPKNASKYSPENLAKIKKRIQAAMSDHGIGQEASLEADEFSLNTKEQNDVMTASGETGAPWEGTLVVEGVESGDGRFFGLGSLDWADLPLPLMYQPTNSGGHTNSIHVGEITHAERHENRIAGAGVVFRDALDGEHGDGIRHMIGTLEKPSSGGISVDVDQVKDADVEYVFADTGDGNAEVNPFAKPESTIFHRGRIRGATLVAFPAFTEAKVNFASEAVTAAAGWCGCGETDVVTASGHTITIQDVPPAHWFDKPTDVKMFGGLTVTDEGRVFGRLAPTGVTHRAVKRKVPMNVDYSRWMNKETIVEGGGRVTTGVITMNCGHAPTENYGTLAARKEHYDNSCSIVANVKVHPDPGGPIVAGALRAGITAEQVSTMMGCELSGDWQPHPDRPGVSELVAALLVPVPGFPQARTQPSVVTHDGVMVASSVPVAFAQASDVNNADYARALDAVARAKGIIAASVGVDPAARKRAIMEEIFEGAI